MVLVREGAHTVDRASYNSINKQLAVHFIKGGTYTYHDVLKEDVEKLFSAGDNFMSVFAKTIRENYIFTR